MEDEHLTDAQLLNLAKWQIVNCESDAEGNDPHVATEEGQAVALARGVISLLARQGCQCAHCRTTHASDCAVHNAPAMPVGACNCGADEPTEAMYKAGLRYLNRKNTAWTVNDLYKAMRNAKAKP